MSTRSTSRRSQGRRAASASSPPHSSSPVSSSGTDPAWGNAASPKDLDRKPRVLTVSIGSSSSSLTNIVPSPQRPQMKLKRKGGVKGRHKWWDREIDALVAFAKKILPVGDFHWQQVGTEYNAWANQNKCSTRPYTSLMKKFKSLRNFALSGEGLIEDPESIYSPEQCKKIEWRNMCHDIYKEACLASHTGELPESQTQSDVDADKENIIAPGIDDFKEDSDYLSPDDASEEGDYVFAELANQNPNDESVSLPSIPTIAPASAVQNSTESSPVAPVQPPSSSGSVRSSPIPLQPSVPAARKRKSSDHTGIGETNKKRSEVDSAIQAVGGVVQNQANSSTIFSQLQTTNFMMFLEEGRRREEDNRRRDEENRKRDDETRMKEEKREERRLEEMRLREDRQTLQFQTLILALFKKD